MFQIITTVTLIVIVCLAIFLSSCGDRPQKDKYPNIKEFGEITTPEYKIVKTKYNEFGISQNFYITMEQVEREPIRQNIVILNKKFEALKKIPLNSSQTFEVFGDNIFIIDETKLSHSIIKTTYPEFEIENIKQITKPQLILESIEKQFPDNVLKSFTYRINPVKDSFNNLYCDAIVKQLSKNLKEVYNIRKYFILDYGDELYYYKVSKYHLSTCWPNWQKKKQVEFSIGKNIEPFDKAFTRLSKNIAIGGTLQNGYQYFKITTQNREIKFKRFLGQYFVLGQYKEVYSNENRNRILLQEYNSYGINPLYWVIEK